MFVDVPDSKIKGGMVNKINELGPGNISKHSSDPQVRNVLDIAPGSLSNRSGFAGSIGSDSRINRVIGPKNSDPAYHVEIAKTANNNARRKK